MRDRVLYAVIITSIVISVAAILAPIAAKPRADPPEITSLTISAEGDAYMIPAYYKAVYGHAVLHLVCTVIKPIKPGVVTFSVPIGTSYLGVDGEVYNVVNGKGNWRSNFKLEIIATVTSGGKTFQLILYGVAEGPPGPGEFDVTFFKPQSKLAGKYLLELEGTIEAS